MGCVPVHHVENKWLWSVSSHKFKSTDTNREDGGCLACQQEPEQEGGICMPGGVPEVPGKVGKMLFSSLATS